jgi:polar amino acid transport system substrate-binding protein
MLSLHSRRGRLAVARLVMASCVALLTGCTAHGGSATGSGDLLATVKADKKLVIGTSNDPPWSSVENGGKASGIVPDVLREVLRRAGIGAEIESIAMPFDSLIPALTAGKIEMIGDSIYSTKERAQKVDFSRTLFYNPPALVVKYGNPQNLTKLSDLCGKTGATYKGTTFVKDLDTASKACPDGEHIEVRLYDTLFATMQDVAAGRVDGALLDSSISAYALANNPNIGVELVRGFTSYDREATANAVAISKGNQSFFDMFNPIYAQMLADGSVAKIFEQHGMTPTAVWLSA